MKSIRQNSAIPCAQRQSRNWWQLSGKAVVLALALFLAVPPQAQSQPIEINPEFKAASALSPEKVAIAEVLRLYLNAVKTLKAHFVQISSTGTFAEGEVYLKRPGMLRFDYQPPQQILLISNGSILAYYDLELEQISHIFLESSPAAFLVRKNVTFDDDLIVTAVDSNDGFTQLTLKKTHEADFTELRVVFIDEPLQLYQWVITDLQGVETVVTLTDREYNVPLDEGLFELLTEKGMKRVIAEREKQAQQQKDKDK